MTDQITVTQPRPDTFSGDNAKLIECIDALLDLDDAKALVPHGLGKGSHAYVLLNAARHRIDAEKRTANRDVVEARKGLVERDDLIRWQRAMHVLRGMLRAAGLSIGADRADDMIAEIDAAIRALGEDG